MKNFKFKIDYRLTLSVVSLFIGFLFIVFAHDNNVFYAIGFWFLATALVMFAFYNADRSEKLARQYEDLTNEYINEIEELQIINTPEAKAQITELEKVCSDLVKRQRMYEKGKTKTKILFMVVAAFLVLAGIFMLFS